MQAPPKPADPVAAKVLNGLTFIKSNNVINIDADFAWSRSRFRDQDAAAIILLAPLNALPRQVCAYTLTGAWSAWSAGLRARLFWLTPLIEDNSVRSASSTLLNTQVGYQFSPRLQGSVKFSIFLTKKPTTLSIYMNRACAAKPTPPHAMPRQSRVVMA